MVSSTYFGGVAGAPYMPLNAVGWGWASLRPLTRSKYQSSIRSSHFTYFGRSDSSHSVMRFICQKTDAENKNTDR